MISGKWYNQFGTKLELTPDNNGAIFGTYNSAAGTAEDYYTLTGRFDADPPPGEGISVGWVVTYRNSKLSAHATVAWSGQHFDVGGANERIITRWQLTSSTSKDNVWDSTNVGHDTFTRHKPSAEEIEQAKLSTVGSPPPEEFLAKRPRP